MNSVIVSAVAVMAVGAGASGQGIVRAWGDNAFGQCNVPTDLGPCTAVAGGGFHTVALRTDGIVRAWGLNGDGQCNVPADLGACTAVAGGYIHTVALRTDGIVRAWGLNGDGQCNVPADLGACTAVAVGTRHTVALAGPPLPDSDGDFRPDHLDNCPTVSNPTQADCDGNGVGDACQSGFADFNVNGIPDYCECIADLFVDGRVNGGDLGALLSQWGAATTTTASDLNRDGTVNGADLAYLLSNWGPCPN